MANDIAIVRALDRSPGAAVFTDITLYQRNPQILRALRLLLPPAPEAAASAPVRLLLRYHTKIPATGQVECIEIPAEAPLPAGAQLLNVTPLPKDWVPDPSTW
jgi:hypothetical protein